MSRRFTAIEKLVFSLYLLGALIASIVVSSCNCGCKKVNAILYDNQHQVVARYYDVRVYRSEGSVIVESNEGRVYVVQGTVETFEVKEKK